MRHQHHRARMPSQWWGVTLAAGRAPLSRIDGCVQDISEGPAASSYARTNRTGTMGSS